MNENQEEQVPDFFDELLQSGEINDVEIIQELRREYETIHGFNDIDIVLLRHINWSRSIYNIINREEPFAQMGYFDSNSDSFLNSEFYNSLLSKRFVLEKPVNKFVRRVFGRSSVYNRTANQLRAITGGILEIVFIECTFDEVAFMGSVIRCNFIKCVFNNCSFSPSENMLGVLDYVKFESCNFDRGCEFNKSKLENAIIINSNFNGTLFANADLSQESCFTDCKFNAASFHGRDCNLTSDFDKCTFDKCSFSDIIIANLDSDKNTYLSIIFREKVVVEVFNLKELQGNSELDINLHQAPQIKRLVSKELAVKNTKHLINLKIESGTDHNKIIFSDIKFIECLDLNGLNSCDITFKNIDLIRKLKIAESSINSLSFEKIKSLVNCTIDKYSFDKDIKITNGYKAVNGIVCQAMTDGNSNASIALVNKSRADMGLVSDAGTSVKNLEHARHLFGVYLLLSGLGVVQFLKAINTPGFSALTSLPILGPAVELPTESFLFLTPLLIVVLLIIKPFVDKAFEWAQYINERDKVTQLTGFAWTLTQFDEPEPPNLSEADKDYFNSKALISTEHVRKTMIYGGPIVYVLLLGIHMLQAITVKGISLAYAFIHIPSIIVLFITARSFYISVKKFQQPFVFNPYDEQP